MMDERWKHGFGGEEAAIGAGDTTMYRLHEPKTREEYLRLPKDLRRRYLLILMEKLGAGQTQIAEMMGVSVVCVGNDMKKLGIRASGKRMTAEQRRNWYDKFLPNDFGVLDELVVEPVIKPRVTKAAEPTAPEAPEAPEETAEPEEPEAPEEPAATTAAEEPEAQEVPEAPEEPEETEEMEAPEQDPDQGDDENEEEENVETEKVEKMTVYISGAITGCNDFSERFGAAEKVLRERGHTVFNPAQNGSGWSYREYINVGLMELMHCDTIYMMRGWHGSVGARLEMEYARACGLRILYEEDA